MQPTLATDQSIEKTKQALEANGFEVEIVNSASEAKDTVLKMIPEQSEVMTMSSVTLEETGIKEAIDSTTQYVSLHNKVWSLNKDTQGKEMNILRSVPDYTVGSVHAVTEDGKVLIASNTGSQLPAYAFGANHVIWVVGTQKIVTNVEDGMKRIEEYVLPLESQRVQKAYGMDRSHISKLLIYNREPNPGRITIVLVKEKLGY